MLLKKESGLKLTTNKNIYWIWENIFSQDEIKKLNKTLLKNSLSTESLKNTAKDKKGVSKKEAITHYVFYEKVKHLLKDSIEKVMSVNEHHFGYDIYPMNDYVCLNYNIYDSASKGKYDWHIDQNTSPILDFKLTMLINLSEEYFEGGDFLLQETNTVQVDKFKTPGSVIIFKPYLRHKVTPVTEGIRRTLTIFLSGPRLK